MSKQYADFRTETYLVILEYLQYSTVLSIPNLLKSPKYARRNHDHFQIYGQNVCRKIYFTCWYVITGLQKVKSVSFNLRSFRAEEITQFTNRVRRSKSIKIPMYSLSFFEHETTYEIVASKHLYLKENLKVIGAECNIKFKQGIYNGKIIDQSSKNKYYLNEINFCRD